MKLKYTKTITAIAASIVAVGGALAVLGVENVPRPAMSSELRELAGAHVELDSRVTSQQLDDAKSWQFKIKRELKVRPDDELLIEELISTDRKINDLEHRLDELRSAD